MEETCQDPRICLCWTRQLSKLYSRLNFNITREVCLYLPPVLQLVWLTKSTLTYFDYTRMNTLPAVRLESPVNINRDSRWAVAGCDSIAICGCGEKWNESYLLQRTGQVQALPGTRYDHQAGGIITWRGAVHVFGSYSHKGGEKCERLCLKSKAEDWTPLEDMKNRRSSFTPVKWRGEVYLCGGWNNTTVEIYDGLHMHLAPISLPEGSPSICYVQGPWLIVLTHNFLSTLTSPTQASVKKHVLCGVYPDISPVLYNHIVFSFSDAGVLLQYSAEDGSRH